MTDRREHLGRIELADGELRYASEGYGTWTLPASHVRVLGETTNEDGPYLEDRFLVFIVSEDDWRAVPMGADGMTPFLEALGQHLHAKIELEFVFSTEIASTILWPNDLQNKPLFELVERKPSTIWKKLMRLVDIKWIDQILTSDVLAFLRQR